MKTRFLILLSIVFFLECNERGIKLDLNFRKAIFLHHSTGANIYRHNSSSITVPDLVKKYNQKHGFTGTSQVQIDEVGWPTSEMGWNNEWYRWNQIINENYRVKRFGLKKLFSPFIDASAEWNTHLKNYPVVIIKSCFPSSEILSEGSEIDTSNLTIKSIFNYKYLWRKIIRDFAAHPDNFFVIWTNAPLVKSATNPEQALLADAFCKWAKDTLATGTDQEFGAFPKNVFVFDFFHHLSDNGILKEHFATSTTDSHPNATASEYVVPLLVNEVFDAALIYEEKQKKK